MKYDFLLKLRCPYCEEQFIPKNIILEHDSNIEHGTIGCRCFEFPIVYGVLLLALTKGYGGAEERFQPYVPLQAAALYFFSRDDLNGFEKWFSKHMPLATSLINKRCTYLNFMKRLGSLSAKATIDELHAAGKYEIIGLHRMLRTMFPAMPAMLFWALELRTIARIVYLWKTRKTILAENFYVQRFLRNDIFLLERLLESLHPPQLILSLCSGHGIFETVATYMFPKASLVCVDGQFLNLLVLKYLIHPEIVPICHDVQLPLPFYEQTFQASFSSSCLQEIPSRAFFTSEKIRVTTPSGWALFDTFWWPEARVSASRSYRFIQNIHESAETLLMLLSNKAQDRRTYWCSYPKIVDPEWRPKWLTDYSDLSSNTCGAPNAVITASNPYDCFSSTNPSKKFMINPRYLLKETNTTCTLTAKYDNKSRASASAKLPKTVHVSLDEKYAPSTLKRLFAMGVIMPYIANFSEPTLFW